MKGLLRNILMLAVMSTGLSAQPRKVLLIGNSYTAYHNLSQMLSQLAAAKGDTLEVFAVSPGGYTFQTHSTYPPTLDMIDSLPWDFVVLQEQSQRPAFPQSQVQTEVYPYARALDSLILLNSPCTETVFFMTWGRKYGDVQNCAVWPPVCSFSGMQQLLRDSYVRMADDNSALVAPAGEAWERSWAADSSINLWVADNSHPSLFGSYLTACVLYSTMIRKPSSGSSWLGGLSPAQAAFLQGVADSTVFDSLSTWKIGEYDVVAGFSVTANGLQVQFNNSSTNSTSYAWSFGDGSVSSQANPVHAYSAPGNYTVTLISGNSCSSDTFLLNISVTTTGLATSPDTQSCRVYAATRTLFWNCNEVAGVEVYSANGQLVRRIAASESTGSARLDGLPAGIYQVLTIGSGKVLNRQRIKMD